MDDNKKDEEKEFMKQQNKVVKEKAETFKRIYSPTTIPTKLKMVEKRPGAARREGGRRTRKRRKRRRKITKKKRRKGTKKKSIRKKR